MRALLVLVLLASVLPVASAQASNLDATIRIQGDEAPAVDAPEGMVRLQEAVPGVRYRFELRLLQNYTTIEIRADGLGLERARQLFPSFDVNESEYPLFVDLPNERIWEVDAPVNVVHVNGTGDPIVTRLGVAGPRNVTLRLDVDTLPPSVTIGERQNLTHIGFYQETRTNEFAIVDLQVRRVGASEWVQNPTPDYHVFQRFPVQGLNAETEYETRFVLTDWAGNENVTPITRFTTPPAPVAPKPSVTIVSPAPDATLPAGAVTVRARIESPDSPVGAGGVRLFFDLRETTEGVTFDGENVTYTPQALLPGRHRVSVEATNEAGGRADARLSFTIAGAVENETPLPAALALLGAGIALALRRRA